MSEKNIKSELAVAESRESKAQSLEEIPLLDPPEEEAEKVIAKHEVKE